MSLSRKRRRKREQRRHSETRPTLLSTPADDVREAREARPSLGWAEAARGELAGIYGTAADASSGRPRDVDDISRPAPTSRHRLREAEKVVRLAYTRRQAAEALGVSLSTIDRRVVPTIDTVLTPWGQRLIPVGELERFVRNHLEPARGRPARRAAGRPPTLPRSVVERICLEYARGRGLSEIARALTAERIPTAHGGRKWWPSTVRAVLVRVSPSETV